MVIVTPNEKPLILANVHEEMAIKTVIGASRYILDQGVLELLGEIHHTVN
jgi:hypothetical protein